MSSLKILICTIFTAACLQAAEISELIEDCLTTCYKIDLENAILIKALLNSHIEKEKNLLETFIEKSNNLSIDFSAVLSSKLDMNDATLKAPDFHKILFESSHIRVLQSVVKCGQCVPFHLHQWNSLMIVTQEGMFKTEHLDGTLEFETCPTGTYEIEAEKLSSSYTNIGDTVFEALIFEIKD